MAWRIDEAVIRGEIDNRIRGRVTGRIWFAGKDDPVELELAGNAWRDLAGRRLEFTNPTPKVLEHIDGIAALQTGVIGDCTASRKVKVPDIPMDQIGEYYAARKKWTWHWGNSLYLEWFSTRNGHVVIASVSFQLTISPDSTWEMTPAEEEQQRHANAEAMGNFMTRLGDAVARAQADDSASLTDPELEEEQGFSPEPEGDAPFAEPRPLSEEEAERMHEESERLVDRIQARIEREGDDADFEKILEEELEKRRQERGEPPPTPEELARREAWIEEMNRAAAESAANLDAELEERIHKTHPVADRAQELAMRLIREPDVHGWLPDGASEEHPLIDLGMATAKASAKFAGALNGEDWPPPVDFAANVIVRLKRARGYLDDALLAAEVCRQQQLGESDWLTEAQRELTSLAHECDSLVGELRARLDRGFD